MRDVAGRYGAPDLRRRTFFRALVDGRYKLVRWFKPDERSGSLRGRANLVSGRCADLAAYIALHEENQPEPQPCDGPMRPARLL